MENLDGGQIKKTTSITTLLCRGFFICCSIINNYLHVNTQVNPKFILLKNNLTKTLWVFFQTFLISNHVYSFHLIFLWVISRNILENHGGTIYLNIDDIQSIGQHCI